MEKMSFVQSRLVSQHNCTVLAWVGNCFVEVRAKHESSDAKDKYQFGRKWAHLNLDNTKT